MYKIPAKKIVDNKVIAAKKSAWKDSMVEK